MRCSARVSVVGEVTRWSRFGSDRLYVRDDYGNDIGWWDLKGDKGHPADPLVAGELDDAVAAWRASQPQAVPSTQVVVQASSAPTADAIEPRGPQFNAGWTDSLLLEPAVRGPAQPPEVPVGVRQDLLHNRAGQALGDKIAEARAAGHRPSVPRRLLLGKAAYSSWELGARGEVAVAAQLAKLRTRNPAWGFLNSIPIGRNGADIDHLAVGPAGVFTLNAKFHSGSKVWVGGNTVMVNGVRQPYVRNSRFESGRVSKLLTRAVGVEVPVTGLVVVVAADSVRVKSQPEDVRVLQRRHLASWLHQQPHRLGRDSIVSIFDAARDPETWAVH